LKKVLVIGAGRSSSSLIRYLLKESVKENWQITVADLDVALVERKLNRHPNAVAVGFDSNDIVKRNALIDDADLVISMLPATMHIDIAQYAVQQKKNLITPSYVSPEMQKLDAQAKEAGVLLLNELGVDPGIDHMSAMEIIHRIKGEGGKIIRFESFTGGLIAPESDNNPWHYKFTWNPRNVIMAGQGGTAQFMQDHQLKYIPPHKIFDRFKEIEIEEHGTFEGYANRDSLSYRKVYGIEDVPTIYRGTLRGKGFCAAWSVFVKLGMTTESFTIENSETMTYREFINAFLMFDKDLAVEDKLKRYLDLSDDVMEMLIWTGIFSREKIGLKNATPALILQNLLESKWKLEEHDKDMIVMWHRFEYELGGKIEELHSYMVVLGEDQTHTAMAETVGVPVGIAAKMILNGAINLTGVQVPVMPEVYIPILEELKDHGIVFKEKLL
jgi:saccharopine dehydrogenase-like NADP-dependent oxidoreductase